MGCFEGQVCLDDQTSGCATLSTEALCLGRFDCDWIQICAGAPAYCYRILDATLCNRQHGCQWFNSGRFCSGTPTPCKELSAVQCEQQLECVTFFDCIRRTPCHLVTIDDCENEPGCTLGQGCEGDVSPCSTLADEQSCQAQVGCFWE